MVQFLMLILSAPLSKSESGYLAHYLTLQYQSEFLGCQLNIVSEWTTSTMRASGQCLISAAAVRSVLVHTGTRDDARSLYLN